MPQNLLCFCLDWAYECPGPLDIDQKPFISEACVINGTIFWVFEIHCSNFALWITWSSSLIQIITKGEQMLSDNLNETNILNMENFLIAILFSGICDFSIFGQRYDHKAIERAKSSLSPCFYCSHKKLFFAKSF